MTCCGSRSFICVRAHKSTVRSQLELCSPLHLISSLLFSHVRLGTPPSPWDFTTKIAYILILTRATCPAHLMFYLIIVTVEFKMLNFSLRNFSFLSLSTLPYVHIFYSALCFDRSCSCVLWDWETVPHPYKTNYCEIQFHTNKSVTTNNPIININVTINCTLTWNLLNKNSRKLKL